MRDRYPAPVRLNHRNTSASSRSETSEIIKATIVSFPASLRRLRIHFRRYLADGAGELLGRLRA